MRHPQMLDLSRRHCRPQGSGPLRDSYKKSRGGLWWEEVSSGVDAIQGRFGEVRYTVVRGSIQLARALHSNCQRL